MTSHPDTGPGRCTPAELPPPREPKRLLLTSKVRIQTAVVIQNSESLSHFQHLSHLPPVCLLLSISSAPCSPPDPGHRPSLAPHTKPALPIQLPDFRLYYKATEIQQQGLGQNQIHRSKEENKEPRNKLMHLWSINL